MSVEEDGLLAFDSVTLLTKIHKWSDRWEEEETCYTYILLICDVTMLKVLMNRICGLRFSLFCWYHICFWPLLNYL